MLLAALSMMADVTMTSSIILACKEWKENEPNTISAYLLIFIKPPK